MPTSTKSTATISPEEAQKLVRSDFTLLPAVSTGLEALCGRILAEPIAAAEDLPTFANSAMDGYAVRSVDVNLIPVRLTVVGEATSGPDCGLVLRAGEAIRIMTGAPIPAGADVVVPVEVTSEAGGVVEILAPASVGDHIRPSGEDFHRGDLVLQPGCLVTPARVGVIAALGRSSVLAIRAARVAILATGDELVEPDQTLERGKVRNSNAYGLFAQVVEAGAIPIPLGVCPDDLARTVERFEAALELADVLVTSGGVSMGRHDHVRTALGRLGEVLFTQVAQQPGKPLTFARVAGRPVFGLPGNPVSTYVNFELFVRPLLRLMMGHEVADRPRLTIPLGEDIPKSPGKALYARMVLRNGKAYLTGSQGSGLWQSLAKADGLGLIPAEAQMMRAGTEIIFLPLQSDLELKR